MSLTQINFVIFSRSYCHLCDELRDALLHARLVTNFVIETLDVDDDPVLLARYDDLVPVLGIRLPDRSIRYVCHYLLDSAAVLEAVGDVYRENVASI